MDQEKMKKIAVPKRLGFLGSCRVVLVSFAGIFALHLGWWRLVETYVPPEERPKHFEILGKIKSLILREKEEENT